MGLEGCQRLVQFMQLLWCGLRVVRVTPTALVMRIVFGAVMPSAVRMATPCSKSKSKPPSVHAGWAMPSAEQRAEDASVFMRWR